LFETYGVESFDFEVIMEDLPLEEMEFAEVLEMSKIPKENCLNMADPFARKYYIVDWEINAVSSIELFDILMTYGLSKMRWWHGVMKQKSRGVELDQWKNLYRTEEEANLALSRVEVRETIVVENVETGEKIKFVGKTAAASFVGLSPTAVSQRLKKQKRQPQETFSLYTLSEGSFTGVVEEKKISGFTDHHKLTAKKVVATKDGLVLEFRSIKSAAKSLDIYPSVIRDSIRKNRTVASGAAGGTIFSYLE